MSDNYYINNLQGNTYQVLQSKICDDPEDRSYTDHVVFQGSLSDCDAWLRLHDQGYIV